jgi:hypothetical protein
MAHPICCRIIHEAQWNIRCRVAGASREQIRCGAANGKTPPFASAIRIRDSSRLGRLQRMGHPRCGELQKKRERVGHPPIRE